MPNQPEEWYDKRPFRDIYYHSDCEANCCCSAVYDIPAIIAEASRRAKLEAWEEAKNVLVEAALEWEQDANAYEEVGMASINATTRANTLRGMANEFNSRIQQYEDSSQNQD